MGKRPVTVRVARWSAEHPWRAMAMWVVFVAVCFVGGSAAGLNEATGDDNIGESGRASAIIDSGNFDRAASENVLITSPVRRAGPGGGTGGRQRRGEPPAARCPRSSVGRAGASQTTARRCWCP